MQNLEPQVNDVLRLLRVMALMLATLIPPSVALLSIAPLAELWQWWVFVGLVLYLLPFPNLPAQRACSPTASKASHRWKN